MWHGVPFACQRRPIVGVLRMCWLLPGSFDCFCCPHTSAHRLSIACLAVFLCGPGALFLHALSGPSTICPFPPHGWSAPDGLPLLLRKQPIWAAGDTPPPKAERTQNDIGTRPCAGRTPFSLQNPLKSQPLKHHKDNVVLFLQVLLPQTFVVAFVGPHASMQPCWYLPPLKSPPPPQYRDGSPQAHARGGGGAPHNGSTKTAAVPVYPQEKNVSPPSAPGISYAFWAK